MNPYACCLRIIGVLHKGYFEAEVKKYKIREVVELPISHEAIGFFDEPSQGGICAVGLVLRLNKDHFFKFKLNCWSRSNTKSKLMALRCLSSMASNFGIDSLKFYGDSMVIMKWAIDLYNLQVITLQNRCWRT